MGGRRHERIFAKLQAKLAVKRRESTVGAALRMARVNSNFAKGIRECVHVVILGCDMGTFCVKI